MRFRGRISLILIIAAMALLSTAGRILGLYADWLWFREVQFTSVFVIVLRAEVILGMVTGAVFFVILYGNVALARWLAPRDVLVVAAAAYTRASDELRRLDELLQQLRKTDTR
jgi:uncharacterized membrane protein (UPF0182 family)